MLGKKCLKFFRGLWAKLSGRFRRRRAAFGIDAAIMIAFILAMMAVLAAAGPNILQWFADILMGGANGAYSLLIELPILDSKKPAEGASPAKWVGYAADSLSGLLMSIGLSLLAVVLIIAAMCYIFETFRFMSEGTAMDIILNSVFTLILIFAVKHIYNGVAASINYLTGWPEVGGSGLIINSGDEVAELIRAMGGGVLTGGWDLAIRFFGSIVIFIISTSILILAIMMGAVRLLLIGALAAALPLLLMLRLIPPVKPLADSLIETIIGMVFASVIAALLIHFGYMLVAKTSLDGLAKLVIALATLAGAAYMSTMFAGRLGSLFMTVGGMASTASATATGLTLGGAALAAGFAGGGIAGAIQASRAGLPIGTGVLRGIAAGTAAVAAHILPGTLVGSGPGRVAQSVVSAVPSAIHAAQSAILSRSGTVIEALLNKFAGERAPGESGQIGSEWYSEVAKMSDASAGEMLIHHTGLALDSEKAGHAFKEYLKSIRDEPVLIDRIRLGLNRFRKMSEEERIEFIRDALKKREKNKGEVVRLLKDRGITFVDPEIKNMDEVPGFCRNILDKESAGIYGETLKARIYALAHENFDARMKSGMLDSAASRSLGRRLRRIVDQLSDEKAAKWAEETFGIRLPEDASIRSRIGDSVKEMLRKLGDADPYLITNIACNIEEKSGILSRRPDEDLKELEEHTKFVIEEVKRELERKRNVGKNADVFGIDGEAFSSFWENIGI